MPRVARIKSRRKIYACMRKLLLMAYAIRKSKKVYVPGELISVLKIKIVLEES